MTDEQCTQELERIDRKYRQKELIIQAIREKRRQKTLDQWAAEHCRFKLGDIIECNGTIIKIDKMRGYKSLYGKFFYVAYFGPQLTKKLEPRKDMSRSSIYDDGSREIKLIKKV